MLRFLPRALAVAAVLMSGSIGARAGTVALTFDDLPVFGRYRAAVEGTKITDRLLDGFARYHWRVTGFVNEGQLDFPDRQARIAMLDHWLSAGMDLGNHTYSHKSLNDTPVADYIADTARDEAVTSALLAARHRHEHWFRYPYLETGRTPAVRRQFERWLRDRGYRVAPVTMENSDWQFAPSYDDAMARGDTRHARHIRRQYLAFTRRIVPWYQQAGTLLLGREPAFVFLLHASRLNADSIDALAAILRHARLEVVPLDRAMRDPAYRIADTYAGPNGVEWLERWSLTLNRDLPFDTIPLVPASIVAEDHRLEAKTDPHTVVPTP